MRYWRIARFERQLVALETDVLKGRAFKSKLVQQMGRQSEHNEATSTSVKRLDVADKSLRDMCANAVAVSVATLVEPQHERVAACISVSNEHIEQRMTDRNKAMRCVKGNLDWIAKEANGGHMEFLECNLRLLETPLKLQYATFRLPQRDKPWGEALQIADDVFLIMLAEEDELADLFAQMLVSDIAED